MSVTPGSDPRVQYDETKKAIKSEERVAIIIFVPGRAEWGLKPLCSIAWDISTFYMV